MNKPGSAHPPKQPRAVVPVSIVRGLVDRCLLDHLIGVDGHGGAHALVRALQAVVVGSEYVHLAGHPGWGEVRQVLAALLLLVDLALVAIVAAVSRLRTATKTRTKDKKQTENHTVQPGSPVLAPLQRGRKGNFPTSF